MCVYLRLLSNHIIFFFKFSIQFKFKIYIIKDSMCYHTYFKIVYTIDKEYKIYIYIYVIYNYYIIYVTGSETL